MLSKFEQVTLETSRSRWKDNIRTDIKETCVNTNNWFASTRDNDYCRAFVDAALDLRVLTAMELVITN